MRSGTRCCVYCCHAAIALSEIIDAGESERRGLGLARGRAYDHGNIPGGSKPLGDDFIHLRLIVNTKARRRKDQSAEVRDLAKRARRLADHLTAADRGRLLRYAEELETQA